MNYHQATKHHHNAYAKGPGRLDWVNQPDPFRRYTGSRLLSLMKDVSIGEALYDEVFIPERLSPVPLNLQSISQLFYQSLAISAWKAMGDVRWALRVNPSSGNLHPTEGYLLCGSVSGLNDRPMVCHYAPKEHGLEVRTEFESALWDKLTAAFPKMTFFIGLTSIHWREEWKYGQRAYRYCQHDVGHAIGAISISAASLGWHAKVMDDLGTDELALLLGTFNHHDAEQEDPEVLIAISPEEYSSNDIIVSGDDIHNFKTLEWYGIANQLSPSHLDWGVDDVVKVTRKPCKGVQYEVYPVIREKYKSEYNTDIRPVSLNKIVHQRRSAVAMDGKTSIPRKIFYRILEKLVAIQAPPLNALPWKPYIHLVLFVHKVDDLPAGLYLLVRDTSQKDNLQAALSQADEWVRPDGCPEHVDFYCLMERNVQEASRQISCFQDIASDGCFSLGMIAEYRKPLEQYGAWFYPRIFWEAGIIGQVLYLEAEAAGIRSTGIGCFLDDAMHAILGLKDSEYQDLYHFTVGGPVDDVRLTTLPPYKD